VSGGRPGSAIDFTGCRDRHRIRLDKVDLSLRLSSDEESQQVAAAQRRLLHLRLLNGGLVGDGASGRRCAS